MESDDDKLWCLPFASRECEQVRMRPSGYFVLCISLELKILILQVGSPLRATGRQEESKLDILSLSLYRNTLDPTPNFDRRKTIYESDTSQVTRVINHSNCRHAMGAVTAYLGIQGSTQRAGRRSGGQPSLQPDRPSIWQWWLHPTRRAGSSCGFLRSGTASRTWAGQRTRGQLTQRTRVEQKGIEGGSTGGILLTVPAQKNRAGTDAPLLGDLDDRLCRE